MLKRQQKEKTTVPRQLLPCELLKALRQRAGYSRAGMTREFGWAGPSNYRRYEEPIKNPERPIPEHIVKKLFGLFVGRGHPPITHDEVASLGPNSDGIKNTSTSVQIVSGTRNSGYSARQVVMSASHGNKGGLPVRVRAERGVYVEPDIASRDFGDSNVLPNSLLPLEAQFCVAVVDDHAEGFGYPKGTALHCCFPGEFGSDVLTGKKVVMWVPRAATGLGEMVVTKFKAKGEGNDNAEWVCEDALGKDIKGRPIGIVVGSLRRE